MPLYTYRCKLGHVSEVRAGFDDSVMPCPACGRPAPRAQFYLEQSVFTETGAKSGYGLPHTSESYDGKTGRVALARFDEAQQEIKYNHAQAEERAEKPLPVRNYWKESLAKANRISGGKIRHAKAVAAPA